MNDLASLDAAIADMREARQSHEDWARHLRTGGCESCSPEVVATAGDENHQVEWVAKYDRVLTILTARRNALRSAHSAARGDCRVRRAAWTNHVDRKGANVITKVALAEMRAMAQEAQQNNGRGKHDDPEYYARNLAALLLIAVEELWPGSDTP